MENLGLVSVIIPVYNVEKYLPKCLDSICNQTYPYLEILVIDDESPDGSGKIANAYALTDNRIKVFHIKNRGAAGARNVGLDNCSGEYVFFVDSDDWIESNMVESLLNRLKIDNSDLAQCQYVDEFRNYSENHPFIKFDGICTDETFVCDMIYIWEYIINCNKIYKKRVIGDIRFVEGRCIDDEFFTYRVIINSKKISLCTDYLYHYRQRRSSAMGNVEHSIQRLLDQVDFVTQRYPILVNKYPKLKSCLLQHMCEVLMSVMRNGSNDDKVFTYAKKKLKKYGIKTLIDMDVSNNIKKSVLSYLFSNRDRFIVDKKKGNYLDYFD